MAPVGPTRHQAERPFWEERAIFIALEGPEGAGKTTQAEMLVRRLREAGWRVVLVREPGGTDLGERLRALLLHRGTTLSARAETLLYLAARAQLVDEVLRPALQRGDVVVSDRFEASTLAYQGYGRGLPLPDVRRVLPFASQGIQPDLTILLDLPAEQGLSRKAQRAEQWNRFEEETLAFHERVRAGYRREAAKDPRRWVVLPATAPIEELSERIWRLVRDALQRRPAHASERPSGERT
ncbi:MAG TPA: dTMP kinase [Chloroflexota bacterium]